MTRPAPPRVALTRARPPEKTKRDSLLQLRSRCPVLPTNRVQIDITRHYRILSRLKTGYSMPLAPDPINLSTVNQTKPRQPREYPNYRGLTKCSHPKRWH